MASQQMSKYGARVNKHSDGVIQVSQTIKSGAEKNARYKIDEGHEQFIRPNEGDSVVGAAVRAACDGKL